MKTSPMRPHAAHGGQDDLDWVAETHPHRGAQPAQPTWWGLTRATAVRVTLAIVVLGIVSAGIWKNLPAPAVVNVPDGLLHTPDASAQPPPAAGAAAEPEVGGTAFVHVAGAVENPGLIELPAGARVADALEVAGGPAPEANLGAINLAAQITDGEQIYVPSLDEEHPPAVHSATQGPGPVNINTASDAELQQLSGIGPVMAERIITYRQDHGPFATVEELQSVPGIGPALMAQLRETITV